MKEIRKFFGREIEPDIRHLYDMKQVIYDREWLKKAENLPLYYMYRDLCREEDREVILENNLRYDITVMPPRMLGREFVKTKGHYHPKINGLTYPEVYEVLKGQAHFLIQKKEQGKITKAAVIQAKTGDHVIVPPNFGHVTINPSGDEVLEMANWVNRSFDSIYKPILRRRGACYFELKSGFKKNKSYRKVPELEIYEASEQDILEGDMYDLIETLEELEFLNYPEEAFFERFDYF